MYIEESSKRDHKNKIHIVNHNILVIIRQMKNKSL